MKTDTQLLVSNSLWSILQQATRVGTLALLTILLSRHFGPQRFGSLAFGLAFVRIFAVLAGFGLDRILVMQLAERATDRREILRSSFLLKCVIASASYLALLVFLRLIDRRDHLLISIVLLAGAALLFQPFDVFDFAFQARSRFRLSFLGRGLPLLAAAGMRVGAILAGAPLLVFALLETVEAALIGGTLFFLQRKLSREPGPGKKVAVQWRPLLAQGFPLLLGSLAVMIYMRADVLMLGMMAGYKAAGIYAAASQICEGCTLVSVALVPALFPVLLRWRSSGPAFYRRQFEKLFVAAFLAGLGVALFLTNFAPIIVRCLFGNDYLPAANVLRILGWSPLFVFLGVTQSGYDVTEGLTWLATLRTAIGAVINIGLNFLLIPRYGPTGAATATVVSFACSAFLLNLTRQPTRPIFALQLRAILLFPVVFRPLRYE